MPIVLVSSEGSALYVHRHSVAKAVAGPDGVQGVRSNPPPCPVFKYSMKMKLFGRKQPIVALYFESKNEFKFYNFEARAFNLIPFCGFVQQRRADWSALLLLA